MAVPAMFAAATGLKALSSQLDVIANNLANANNDGYKSSRANFEDLMYQYAPEPGAKNGLEDVMPMGVATGYGTRLASTQLDMAQGATLVTGKPLDVCIQGDGFFRVKVLSSQRDGLAYTRTGKFFTNDKGEIVMTSGGYKLDPNITIPPNSTGITIGADGRVSATLAGATTTTDLGQIQLARFNNPQGLVQIGGNLYQASDASGTANLANPGTDGLGTLQQGAVESSNVDPVKELVDLIKTQRTFELNSQSIQAADQMLQQIGNLRR